MCGRFTLTATLDEVKQALEADILKAEQIDPNYNIAPSMEVLVLISDGSRKRLGSLMWGFTPLWIGGKRLINARAESLYSKPTFKKAVKTRRCLIPASGFYEWKNTEDGKKPYFIHHKSNELLAFAGLWQKEVDDSWSCIIVTTEASEDMKELHHRMPLFLEGNARKEWLDPQQEDVKHLLSPPPSGRLTMYPISTRVNRPRENDADLLKPAAD
jgi:putative SOS response-associated peptidase YedK